MEQETPAIKEYRQAFDEFFKGKPEPKDEEEYRKMLDEFYYWYNNVRKQSDTGKTPNEMYKEIYGEESSEQVDLSERGLSEQEIENIRHFFDENFWPKIKNELKEKSKKESCFISFLAGIEESDNFFVDDLWSDESFAETLNPDEIKEKLKSFYKENNEDMNYNCKKCNKKISAHNKDWHNGMCDDCFNK